MIIKKKSLNLKKNKIKIKIKLQKIIFKYKILEKILNLVIRNKNLKPIKILFLLDLISINNNYT